MYELPLVSPSAASILLTPKSKRVILQLAWSLCCHVCNMPTALSYSSQCFTPWLDVRPGGEVNTHATVWQYVVSICQAVTQV